METTSVGGYAACPAALAANSSGVRHLGELCGRGGSVLRKPRGFSERRSIVTKLY